MELKAFLDIKELDVNPGNRLRSRANPNGSIPSNYDDLSYNTRERAKPQKTFDGQQFSLGGGG
jgi:hypothetical protein